MACVTLRIGSITVEKGSLALQEPTVLSLMDSMASIGLINPISVWRPTGVLPRLAAGRHRFEAARRLGWTDILCNVFEQATPPDADMIEVVENLHRREIGSEEKDALLVRYVALVEARKAAVAAPAISVQRASKSNPKGSGRKEAAASLAARELGVDKSTVTRAIARHKARGTDGGPTPTARAPTAPVHTLAGALALLRQIAAQRDEPVCAGLAQTYLDGGRR